MTLPPGRELDALVAEKVMGEVRWRVHFPPVDPVDEWDLSRSLSQDFKTKSEAEAFRESKRRKGIPDWAQPRTDPIEPKRYSTDIAAAWEVLERLQGSEPRVWWNDETHGWLCAFDKAPDGVIACETTAPHAICLAALEAVKSKA